MRKMKHGLDMCGAQVFRMSTVRLTSIERIIDEFKRCWKEIGTPIIGKVNS